VCAFINLEPHNKRVVFKGDFELDSEFVFSFFDSMPAADYESEFERALVLGCYALRLNGTGELLNRVAMDLNGELRQLRVLMDLRGLKERVASFAGQEAEFNIIDTLQAHCDHHQWQDEIANTGGYVGALPRRKVGDAVITISGTDRRIVIESKADKSVSLGDPSTTDPLKTKANFETKTAYGQSLTALANRQADVSIMVHFADNTHASVRAAGLMQFLPEQPGFVVIVDRVNGDWSALTAAYTVARGMCLAWEEGAQRWEAVDLIVKRLQRELARMYAIDSQLERVRTAAQEILGSLETVAETRNAVRDSLALISEAGLALLANPVDTLTKRAVFLDESNPPPPPS